MTGTETAKNGTYIKFEYKSSVPVRVYTETSGEGITILRRRALVVNSSSGQWNGNETLERAWARDHCLCPGCNGIDQGTCDPCVPLTPNCDARPPVFKCWVTISKPLSSLWAYKIQVQRVRFTKDYATIINWGIVISLIVFAVVGVILIVVSIVLQMPQELLGDIFPAKSENTPLTGGRKRVGPW